MKKSLRSKQPITSVLNPRFNYTRADSTDLAKTFDRARKAIKEEQQRMTAPSSGSVFPLRRKP